MPKPAPAPDRIVYKATYSGTPVYEFIAKNIACMRRRSDSWVNATQILKVADFDKPQRTRILEREVQRGTHEKVQGGYGKYQGTWVPLDRAREIAAQYNVEQLLLPIFEFRPSTESPPLAPKHVTAASTKPRPPRAAPRQSSANKKAAKAPPPPPPAPPSEDSFASDGEDGAANDNVSDMELEENSRNGTSTGSDEEYNNRGKRGPRASQNSAMMTLKRKRSIMDSDQYSSYNGGTHHRGQSRRVAYSDELLDYLTNKNMEVPQFLVNPPRDFNVNEVIDTEGHTAIHWAAAMGDLNIVELLITARADILAKSNRGETPLMRAVLFTNNYDRRSFPRLVEVLRGSIFETDNYESTVFHHIAATTSSKNKLMAARYYIDVLLQKLTEMHPMEKIKTFLDAQDQNGDTALTISARNVAKKCVRTLLGYNASPDIRNNHGESPDDFIAAAEKRTRYDYPNPSSSSPYAPRNPYDRSQSSSFNHSAPFVAQPHNSEAAISATKKVVPLMAEMLEGLATSFDKELYEKDEDHAQAQDLLATSMGETDEWRRIADDQLRPFGTMEELDSQNEGLKKEAEQLGLRLHAMMELSQHQELAQIIKVESDRLEAEERETSLLEPPAEDELQDLVERFKLAKEIADKQAVRKTLMEETVQGHAKSGAGGKIAEYRRLIGLSCGLHPDDVEKLLPEILRDLETGQHVQAGIAGERERNALVEAGRAMSALQRGVAG